MLSLRWYALLSMVAVGVMICVPGCPPTTTSVLEGTWTLTEGAPPDANLTQVLLTFDSTGNLTTVTYVYNNKTVTSTKAELTSTTTVSGQNVTISSTFGPSGNSSLDFTGTLNSDNTVITGQAKFTLVISSTTTVTFPLGAATLTKGVIPVGNAAAGETLFNDECAACHTAAGLAPSADLIVNDLGTINAAMDGIELTDQQILDLQAYLATVSTVTGDAAAGETLFDDECSACHTAEDLAPSANLIVNDLGTINAAMDGLTLTDQQVADLQAYLATVTVVTGDAAAGETLFDDECSACHTAAGLAPSASAIVNDLGTLNAAMSGLTLTDQQIADLQAYLATQ